MKRATTGKTIQIKDRSDLARVSALRDEDIAHDEDNPPTTLAEWEGATMQLGGQVIGMTPRRRGPGKKPPRTPIQLRLPPDVLARWKATGPGWQTRMVERLSAP
jgi:uncharacterized protein (DUF4415 family)